MTTDAALAFIRDCAAKDQRFLAEVWFGSPQPLTGLARKTASPMPTYRPSGSPRPYAGGPGAARMAPLGPPV